MVHLLIPSDRRSKWTSRSWLLARGRQKEVTQMKNVEDIYPLSPMQQGMLAHALYAPRSEGHIEQFQCTLQGSPLTETFRAAWDYVIVRHQALRTSFLWEELDTPLQVVQRTVTLPWQVLD